MKSKNKMEIRHYFTQVFCIILLCSLFVVNNKASAQNSSNRKKQAQETHQIWKRMINTLHINLPDSLPPEELDPNRPPGTFREKKGSYKWYDSAGNFYMRSAWGVWNNYDESKAMNYHLPNALVLNNGLKVTTAKEWWNKRRPQIIKLFNENVYGLVPKQVPDVNWEVVHKKRKRKGGIPVIIKKLAGHVDNSMYHSIDVNIRLTLVTPANATGPVPVIMALTFAPPPGVKLPPKFKKMMERRKKMRMREFNKTIQVKWKQQVLNVGWGYAELIPTSIQPDNGAGLRKGIIGLTNKGKLRQPDEWGALRAWAWGASRAMDYLETDSSVDANKVAIEGLSRYGKAALVTMAYDRRFAIGFIASSGKGGAALLRHNFGEDMGDLAGSGEFQWFAGNFLKYAGGPSNLKDLPVDANELIALCAPRPVFISVGSPKVEGTWVDDKGQFLAEAAAGSVYKLLGKKGLGTDVMPPMGTPLMSGALAFRQHFGRHTAGPNWPYFLKFAKRYFEK